MDKQGPVVPREDYRATTFTNDRKNQRHDIKGTYGSHCTTLDRRASKGDEACPFTLSIFLDSAGYYLKLPATLFFIGFMPGVITSVLLLLSSIQTKAKSYLTLALPEPKRE
jgi:hypothetical protein